MLQSWVFFFILILSANPARAVLFKAPLASEETLQKESLRQNQPTYAQWVFDKSLDESVEAHPQVEEFVQKVLQSPQKTSKQDKENWNYLRSALELNRADREMLFLLAQKIKLRTEMCRYLLLEKEWMSEEGPACQKLSVTASPSLKAQLQARDVLMIDGKAFNKEQVPPRFIAGNYHWKIISSEFQDRSFHGSAEQFARQKFAKEPWVEGSCSNAKLRQEDFNILTQAKIVFNQDCTTPALQTPSSLKSWAKEHETLLWTVGLVVSGLAVYHLKDKDVTITWPK